MQTVVKRFDELSNSELYEILKVRAAVFVVEQHCAYQDLDDIDQEAWHVYLRENGQIVGYLRVIEAGKRLEETSIGRVISLKRRCGVGTKLMQAGICTAIRECGAKKIKIGAQVQAQPFYESVGFRCVSDEYLEDGIPHVYMVYEVQE